jgi:hypothetical protein
LHLKLAEISGRLDADAVADELTTEQMFEWWAYGYLQGWFPQEEEKRGMDPAAAQEFFQRLGNG